MPQKPLVIFHHPCADGFGAALAAWLKLGESAEYCGRNYNQPFDTLPSFANRDVYILDFGFSKEQTQEIMCAANRFVWLDHHKTSFDQWCGDQYLTDNRNIFEHSDVSLSHRISLNNNKSGAMLAWEYFIGDHIPKMIRHIDDSDRWQFKMEDTKPFICHLNSLEMNFHVWGGLLEHTEHSREFVSTGRAIEKFYDKQVLDVLEQARRPVKITDWDDKGFGLPEVNRRWIGLAANANAAFTSVAGNLLAQESGTFGLIWHMRSDGTILCSLRSCGSYDVSLIARRFGGGGHRNAAGFTTTMEVLQSWL